jgi:hypothetical protein
MVVRVESLENLIRALDGRWRLRHVFDVAVNALTVSITLSICWIVFYLLTRFGPGPEQVLLLVNGAALVVAMVVAALSKQPPQRLLIDADRAYGLHELLVSGLEFSRPESNRVSDDERSFRRVVAERANNVAIGIDPLTVYPRSMPRRTPLLAALIVGLGVMVTLLTSGWFDRSAPTVVEGGMLLEETGRRLAERAPENEELQQLADEIRRLGDQMRNNEISAAEARRRIDLLGRSVEEQVGNLNRTPEFENREDAELPPETEDSIRRALQQGMSEGQVTELFTRMRSEGNTIPEMIDALEQASPDRPPNADLNVDPERIRDLMDQLNPPTTEEDVVSDTLEDLDQARRSLGSPSGNLSEFTQGEDGDQTGGGGGGGGTPPRDANMGGGGEGGGGSADGSESRESPGQLAGDQPEEDRSGDDYDYPDDAAQSLREVRGIIANDSIMDLLIRELPSEATSEMTEQERNVYFQRVIEEAVGREDTPPDLQRLVRNYFLRVTIAATEGASNEQ